MAAARKGVALVTGANRGLGLAFSKALASRNMDVIAACRDPSRFPSELKVNGVEVLKLDVERPDDIAGAAEHVKATRGKLDLLVNSAGILHPTGRGETRLEDVTAEHMEKVFRIDAFGPMLMSKAFAPLLKQGDGAIGSGNSHKGMIVCISAHAASITDTKLGGWYTYRMAKIALNMSNVCVGIELGRGKNKVIALTFHPGVLDTDLSRPYHRSVPADQILTADASAEKLVDLMSSASLKDSGRFIDVSGTDIPW